MIIIILRFHAKDHSVATLGCACIVAVLTRLATKHVKTLNSKRTYHHTKARYLHSLCVTTTVLRIINYI